MANLPLVEVPIGDYGADESAMVRYLQEGSVRALALGNRGPIRLDEYGRLEAEILDSYKRHGFYIFEGVFDRAELEEVERDVADMLDRAPASKDAPLGRQGRPALGADR